MEREEGRRCRASFFAFDERRRLRQPAETPTICRVRTFRRFQRLAAARAGDFDTLIAALDPDVVLRDDRRS